jgi:hypothetical protein
MGAVRRGANLYLGILKTEPEHEGVDRRVVFDVSGDGLVGLLQVADLKPDRPVAIAQQQHLLNRNHEKSGLDARERMQSRRKRVVWMGAGHAI